MKFQAVDISKTETASTIIARNLRRAIIAGDLRDGEQLRQDQIAKAFNTSRYPVRDALAKLEQQGLVEHIRNRGTFVATLSLKEAQEIFHFRSTLEAEVMRRAVPNITPEIIARARTHQDDFASATDPLTFSALNKKFHMALYQASDQPFHLSVIETAMSRIDRYLRAQLVMSDGMAQSSAEHDAILSACAAGDADTAAQLTAQHIDHARVSLETQLAKS